MQHFLIIACLVMNVTLLVIFIDGALSAIKTRGMIEEIIRRYGKSLKTKKTGRKPKWMKMKN